MGPAGLSASPALHAGDERDDYCPCELKPSRGRRRLTCRYVFRAVRWSTRFLASKRQDTGKGATCSKGAAIADRALSKVSLTIVARLLQSLPHIRRIFEFRERCRSASSDVSSGGTATFNGIGTAHYASGDPCPICSSVIKRLFCCLVYIPLIQLGKFR
jgi:hypothetical protein